VIRGMIAAAACSHPATIGPTRRLWLRFEGGFSDSGPSGLSVTNSGATLDTAVYAEGASSALVATSQNSNVLTVAHHASTQVESADFEIGIRVRFSSIASASVIYTKSSGTGAYPYQIIRNSSNALEFRGFAQDGSDFSLSTAAGFVSVNTWYFVQGRRVGNVMQLLVDGVSEASQSFAKPLQVSTSPTNVGNYGTGGYPVVGWVDDVYFDA
jgi:hypothetical protein